MVAGLTNVAGLLLDWIEAEAEHRSELIAPLEQHYPSFETHRPSTETTRRAERHFLPRRGMTAWRMN
jgi:hypothetical protein